MNYISICIIVIEFELYIITEMSRKLKFKIISCSSEEQQYPVSSLLFNGSEGWQSKRFCNYPQQITVEFYGIVNVQRIQLVSDHRKITSQVDILYYVPIPQQEQRFYKYGYLQFNRPDSSNLRQIKTINVNLNCLYLRFLFHKPYPSKENFFSQIGLAGMTITGLDQPSATLQEGMSQVGEDKQEGINEQDQNFINQRVAELNAQKNQAIAVEDYEGAANLKSTIGQVEKTRLRLRQWRIKINRAIQNQDFDAARKMKAQMQRQKQEINSILDEQPQQHQPQPNQVFEQNQFADLNKSEQPAQNEFMENPREIHTRHQTSKAQQKIIKSRVEDNYDQRVIPTVNKNNRNNTEFSQVQDQKPKPLPPVQQVQGKYIKDATVMQQYFDQQTVKKFFSVQWQYNLDSLLLIQKAIGSKPKENGLIKCLITIVKYSSRQSNFQVGIQSLNVFKQLLRINNQSHALSKPGQSQNDLDQIGKEIVKKLADNNAKTKQAAEQCFSLMINSLLYGVEASSLLLSKTKNKLTSKQIITRLHLISNMIQDHGIGSPNAVPLNCLQFAIEHCSNPGQEVRKTTIQLLRVAYKRDPGKTQIKLMGLKQTIQQQIRQQKVDTPVRVKKK